MPRKIVSLSQLPNLLNTKEVLVSIGGEEFIITLKKHSYRRWKEVELDIPLPEPHYNYNSVTGRRDYEMNHPVTLERFNNRANEITLRRLADAIQEDFPNDRKTLSEKADWLSEVFDETTISELFRELEILNGEAMENVSSNTEFRTNDGTTDDGDVGNAEVGENP